MRNRMQARQGGVDQIGQVGQISPLGRRVKDRIEGSSNQRSVRAKTSAKIVKELKRPQGETAGIRELDYRVRYTEDNVIGIAWCDIVFK